MIMIHSHIQNSPYTDLLIGIVFVFIGVSSLLKRRRILKNGIKTTGTLTELNSAKGMRSFPVVRYKTLDNKYVVKQYDTSGYYSESAVGSDILIIYDKNSIEDYIIDNRTSKFIGPIFTIIGIALLSASIYTLIFKP